MDSRYQIDTRPMADAKAVVQGDRYRITVLTAGVIRLEYAEDGIFEDRASAFALFRELAVPDFSVIEREHHVEIITDRVQLVYDRAPFSTSGLSIQVRGNLSSYHSIWRFGEMQNDLKGTARTLDFTDGAVPLESGIVSRQGFSVLDDSKTLVLTDDGWVAPRDGTHADLYFFGYGLDYREAIKAFYAISGATPVLPRFALGNWWSRYHKYTAQTYTELIEGFAEQGLPFSVSVIDMDWHQVDIDPKYGSGWTGYSWNREMFPDPAEFLKWLHDNGLRVTLNVHPADGVRAFEDVYPEMAVALGIDPESAEAIAFDVTDQDFLTAYFDILHRSLERDGVDFWWLDWQSGPHSRVAGIDPLWMLNHFHFLDNARDDRRPLTFSRFAGPGSHRYPIGFSGDTAVTWESLDFQPYFTATASNIGYGWWSHDIGGHFMGVKDDELATRWVQLGVFSPIMRLHSGANAFNSKEPARFNTSARLVMTDFLRLRHRLLPYLDSMNHVAAQQGLPLVQPMYWSYPQTDDAYAVPNQYTFGTELIVAPITTPQIPELQMAAVRTWLPEGVWIDVFTGQVYDGGRAQMMYRDLTSVPVLARAGGIIPLDAAPVPANDPHLPAALEVLIVVGADGTFEMIEDDGTATGSWAKTLISYSQSTGAVTIETSGDLSILPDLRSWQLTFLGVAATAAVESDFTAVRVEPVTGKGFSVRLPDVPTADQLALSIGPNPALAPNDVATRLFNMLDRAHIAYETKSLIYNVATSDRSLAVRLSHLQAQGINRHLEAAVNEILLARVG